MLLVMLFVASSLELVQVPFIQKLCTAGEPIILIVSPGAILAAVAPVVSVFHLVAKLVPTPASLPPS